MINEIPIVGLGTFSTTQSEGGYISGKAVKIVSTFTGSFEGSKAAGTYNEEVGYEDGSG